MFKFLESLDDILGVKLYTHLEGMSKPIVLADLIHQELDLLLKLASLKFDLCKSHSLYVQLKLKDALLSSQVLDQVFSLEFWPHT